jgi:phage shock protein C
MMQAQRNLFMRDDTFFGVCQGLGEDLGIPPNLLRLTVAGLLFFDPMVALYSYLGAAVLVLATRLLIREPRVRRAAPQIEEPTAHRSTEMAIGDEAETLPLAA